MSQLVFLVLLSPLVGFLINGLFRKYLSKPIVSTIGCGVILASFIGSLILFMDVRNGNSRVVELFDFVSFGNVHVPFALLIDQLSSIFLLIITGVGFLIHLYSTAYMKDEKEVHFARYFSYLNLFVFSMLLLVMGANYVIMFMGWEGVGLCSYLLIGFWFKNDDYNNAAKKAFVMNRIGDLGFLVALFWILAKVGSVAYADVFAKAPLLPSTDVTAITLLLFFAATGKSAQIPLYTWLPDAMAGPTPVSALIHAATMVTAGIYMIARSNVLYTLAPISQAVVAIIGLATAIFAATIALKQNDIKKVLAYSTISQLGYMFLGLGVGAYTGAVFHVMTHAFFKALLFLGAGSVIQALHHEQDIQKMGGLKKYLPVTHITFLIGCLAISGMPPLSGFFSKDEILSAAYQSNKVYWIIGVFGAGMTAFYMFRLYATTFLGKFRGTQEQEHHLHESPPAMTIPLIALAVLAIVGGWVGIPDVFIKDGHSLEHFLAPIFADSYKLREAHPPDASTQYLLMGISMLIAAAAIFIALGRFSKKPDLQEARGFGKVLSNKWYVDELYDKIIVSPLNAFGKFLDKYIEKSGIDAIVNGIGKGVHYGSRQLRLLQSGQVGSYVLLMIVGMIILFALQFFLKK